MTVLTGQVQKVGSKKWDDGNTSYSIHLLDKWYTNYAFDTKGQPMEGDWIEAIIIPSKTGKEYIKDWQSKAGYAASGQHLKDSPAPAPQTNGAAAHVPQTHAPTDDTWRKKDLTITTMAIFKTLWVNGIVEETDNVKSVLDTAFRGACFIEKKVAAYVAGADIEGMKQNLADEVEAKRLAEMDDIPQPSPDQHPAFDDDIPF